LKLRAQLLFLSNAVLSPLIFEQPANVTVIASNDARLAVFAGPWPLSFQWFCEGSAIESETNSALLFHHVNGSEAGAYSVVVSNSAGAVTSIVATVAVANRPQ